MVSVYAAGYMVCQNRMTLVSRKVMRSSDSFCVYSAADYMIITYCCTIALDQGYLHIQKEQNKDQTSS